VPVAVETVGRAAVRRTLVLAGSIRPESQVRIFSKVAGRIEELKADTCDQVKTGQVLARIDSDLQAAGLKQAQAARAVAQVVLADAERDWKRAEELFRQAVVNEQVRDKARAGRDLAERGLAQAEAAVLAAQVGLDETTIRATIDGTVTHRYFDKGDFVSPGQPLFAIQDLRTVKVLASVPQADLLRLVPGASRARVTVEGAGEGLEALVSKVEPALDPATLSAPIEIRVENRRRQAPAAAPANACAASWLLFSGMSARVELIIEGRADAPVLPLEAIRNDGRKDFVFVLDPAGATVQRLDVKLGKLGAGDGEMVRLVEFLEPADLVGRQVVTRGVSRVTDGSPVQVTGGAGPPPAAAAATDRPEGGQPR